MTKNNWIKIWNNRYKISKKKNSLSDLIKLNGFDNSIKDYNKISWKLMVKDFLKYNRDLKAKGGRIGFKKGGDLGMQSVKYGIDKNPNITAADPKAKFIAANKKNKKSKKKVI